METTKDLLCQVAASINSNWITNHPSANRLQINNGRTSRFVQLALIAAEEAMVNSGLDAWLGNNSNNSTSMQCNATTDKSTFQRRRESFGVSIGNEMSSTRDISTAFDLLRSESIPSRAHRRLSPHFVPRILPNSPSARVAIHNKLLGPNISHSEACAAGACAIAHGMELIQSGRIAGMDVRCERCRRQKGSH
jgi:3-oxoacyl-[acyl-carrier-protein] synthase II